MVYAPESDIWQSILQFIPKRQLCEISPVSRMLKREVDKQLKARVRTCLLTMMQNSSGDVPKQFTEIQVEILADENSSKRWRHFLRAIERTLANLPSAEVESSKLRNLTCPISEFAEMRTIGQTISDLVDSRDFWNYSLEYSRRNKSAVYHRMKSFKSKQVVQSFNNLYFKGYIEQALHFAGSFKIVFQDEREYQLAYKNITLICIEQCDAPSAVVAAEWNQPRHVDTIKKLALEHYLSEETQQVIPTIESRKIDVLIALSNSLHELDWKLQYFISSLWALLKQKQFDKVYNYLQVVCVPPDQFFPKMLRSSFLDWSLAEEFVTYLPPSAIRDRLILILTGMKLSRLPQLTLHPTPVPDVTRNDEVGKTKKLHQLAISDLERPKRYRTLVEIAT